jgi:thiol-disulfide isomerase/thioredoxin
MQEDSNLGGRHKNTLIIGKIFADWCGHCVALVPEWKKMKQMIYHKRIENANVIFKELGDTKENKKKGIKVDSLIAKFNTENRKGQEPIKIDGGFPTIFKIYNGKLEYYKGARDAKSIFEWASSNLKSKTNAYFPGNPEKNKTFSENPESNETFFGKIIKNIFGQKGKTMKGGTKGGTKGGKSRRFISKNKTRRVRWA